MTVETPAPPASPAARSGAPSTIARLLLQSLESHRAESAILQQVKGKFQSISYGDLYTSAVGVARGMLSAGVQPEDRVGIISENRAEWLYIDAACQFLGTADVPLYPTLPAGQTQYILSDSATRVVVVENRRQLDKILESWDRLPQLERVIVIETSDLPADTRQGAILSLEDLVRQGGASQFSEADVLRLANAVQPDQMATVIYTSGTTGDPKGAMLSQSNFMSNLASVRTIIQTTPSDLFLSFAPLNHVFERLAGYYLPVSGGSVIAYPESTMRVRQNLPETRPTVMIGVPRLYDGLKEAILANVAKAPPKLRKMFQWASSVGALRAVRLGEGRGPGPLLALQWALADRLVLQKLRSKLGLDRLRYFVSGSAPLARETGEFLLSIGVSFLEGWGLTETSPVLAVNRPGRFRLGSVGLAIPGVEMKVADDGELLARGPNIMMGYLNKPEATAEAIDPDGWFHTGDVGRIDSDGFIFITDRKKDLLVLATGKKVAPQPIEEKLKSSPLIREAVVLGDRMSACVALIIPNFDRLAEQGRTAGWKFDGNEQLAQSPEARKLIRQEIDRTTSHLAEYEKIRHFALLNAEFSVDGGELTPTLKVKRKVVLEKYADVIRSLNA